MYKIALTGPESVGKSTLAINLAEHFKGIVVTEFARDYIENLHRKYTYIDVETIARKQVDQYIQISEKFSATNQYAFFDTFLIITKVWFNVVYNRYPNWLENAIHKYQMDLYLLCYPDLPWIADGVRENEDLRTQLFETYKQELDNYGFNYQIIKGVGPLRMQNAVNEIKKLI